MFISFSFLQLGRIKRLDDAWLLTIECVLLVLFNVFWNSVRVCGDWLVDDLAVEKIKFLYWKMAVSGR